MQRQQAALQLHDFIHALRQGGGAELVHQARSHVGGDADVAARAAEHEDGGGGVVARIDGKAFGRVAQQPLAAVDVAGGVLDADHAGHLRQTHGGVVLHIGHGAAGHVVEHDGQVARAFGDGFEVGVNAFLRGLVVVGHDLELAVGAHLARIAGQGDGFGGGVGAAAGHHGHATGGLLDGHADDFLVLGHGDGGRFARGADDADAVGAFGDVPVNEFAQRGVVHAAVVKHGRDQRNDAALDGFHVGACLWVFCVFCARCARAGAQICEAGILDARGPGAGLIGMDADGGAGRGRATRRGAGLVCRHWVVFGYKILLIN